MNAPLIRSRMKIDTRAIAERDQKVGPVESFKKSVMDKLGKVLDGIIVTNDNVLIATYIQPAKTAGGILLPDAAIDEDRYQGIAGMVLKLGESAFKYDGQFPYEGTIPQVGSFVMYHRSETREVGIMGLSCRLVPSSLIRMINVKPEDFY